MSRGASARLGSHSGDMGGREGAPREDARVHCTHSRSRMRSDATFLHPRADSMGPPIPMSPVVSGAHSGAQGTPRHSNIIISPKIITSGDMSSTRKVSSRAASPGGHGPQLIQHLSPANRNRSAPRPSQSQPTHKLRISLESSCQGPCCIADAKTCHVQNCRADVRQVHRQRDALVHALAAASEAQQHASSSASLQRAEGHHTAHTSGEKDSQDQLGCASPKPLCQLPAPIRPDPIETIPPVVLSFLLLHF